MIANGHYAFLHGVGTCPIGADAATSVVDADLHGVEGPSVVDASVLPTAPAESGAEAVAARS